MEVREARNPRHVHTANSSLSFIDPDNTRTPLIAWGKGIRGPLPDSNPPSHDDYSIPWDLNDVYRRDVEQADITALMSALIGIDWPINSVGVLPDVDPTRPGFLEGGDGDMSKAELALVNAKVCWCSSTFTCICDNPWFFRSCLNISDENTVGCILSVSESCPADSPPRFEETEHALLPPLWTACSGRK